MSIIQQKLKKNKSRMRKEKILSALKPAFSDFLLQSEYEVELPCLRNATYPNRDNNFNNNATSPGGANSCNNFTFRSWPELITVLMRFQQVKNYIGWFFLDNDGPYFKISLNALLSHVPYIAEYGTQNDHYYFGWIGESDNVGIILGDDQLPPGDKKFSITLWGI